MFVYHGRYDGSQQMRQCITLGSNTILLSNWLGMYQHAVRDCPRECCGVFLEALPADRQPLEWHACGNVQARMHAMAPERYTRSPEQAYLLDPKDWLPMQRRLDLGEARLAVVYHSHVEAPAFFSEEDQRFAKWGDHPVFPDTIYLVISVMGGFVDHWKTFEWNAGSGSFRLSEAGRERSP